MLALRPNEMTVMLDVTLEVSGTGGTLWRAYAPVARLGPWTLRRHGGRGTLEADLTSVDPVYASLRPLDLTLEWPGGRVTRWRQVTVTSMADQWVEVDVDGPPDP